jgi:DNA repair protein RecN (Recombination protein N)
MLALKAVLAAHDKIPVLVFDEIDANVGGETSVAVAAKLALVADRRQVLCITHLPQVAAQGATHIRVRKEVRDGRTYTTIERLDASTRVEEVARMLGGRDLTSVTIRHAKELLRQSAAGRKDKAE